MKNAKIIDFLVEICYNNEYCGTQQTLPRTDSDVIANLFNRANNLRMKNEFDKAKEVYEKIVSKQSDDAEAYWRLVLCKFGIEYVEDPETFKKITTSHRTQLESVLTDVDYQSALENASPEQKVLYEAEAREIDRLQGDILEIVRKEKTFDVFICYKESDENAGALRIVQQQMKSIISLYRLDSRCSMRRSRWKISLVRRMNPTICRTEQRQGNACHRYKAQVFQRCLG